MAQSGVSHDPRRGPTFHRRGIGRGCHLEIVGPGDMLHDLAADVVPHVDAILKMGQRTARGEAK